MKFIRVRHLNSHSGLFFTTKVVKPSDIFLVNFGDSKILLSPQP